MLFSRPVIDEDDDDERRRTKQRIEKPQETIVVVVVVAVVVVVVAVVVVVVVFRARLSFAFECVFMCVNFLCGTKRCKNEEERADRRERQPFERKMYERERESVGG